MGELGRSVKAVRKLSRFESCVPHIMLLDFKLFWQRIQKIKFGVIEQVVSSAVCKIVLILVRFDSYWPHKKSLT